MEARIRTVKIDPYDQVVALTQHMINQGISNLYTALANPDGPQLLKPMTAWADENNFFEQVMFGPPAILVKADAANTKSIDLQLPLISGKVQLRSASPINDDGGGHGGFKITKLTMPVEGWMVTIPVDINFTELDTSSQRNIEIADLVKKRLAAHWKPDHSIYELLLDLTTMQVGNVDWDMGKWAEDDLMTVIEPNKEPQQMFPPGAKLGDPRKLEQLTSQDREKLGMMLTSLVRPLSKANINSLGFAVKDKGANKKATFEVRDIRYQSYMWTDPSTGKAPGKGYEGDSRLNYLLYLETLSDHPLPDPKADTSILKQNMGNWTTGRNPGKTDEAGKFGSFVLSSENFMKNFILPKLSAVNLVVTFDLESMKAYAEDHAFSYKYGVDCTWSRPPDPHDTTNNFTDGFYGWDNGEWKDFARDHLRYIKDSPPGSDIRTWFFEGGSGKKGDHAKDGSTDTYCYGFAKTYARVYTTAGSNKIVYEGRGFSRVDYMCDSGIEKKNTSAAEWSITLTLQEVHDGGMQIGIEYKKPNFWFWDKYGGDSSRFEPYITSRYETAGKNFEYLCNSMRDCLQGQESFVFPASGVFYFKNPMMNHRGDLLADLEYNGTPDLQKGMINKNAITRNDISKGNYEAPSEKGREIKITGSG